MRVLITGSSGFIGQHLCSELAARGYRVVRLNRAAATEEDELDVVWPAGIQQLDLSHFDAVVHLATAPVNSNSSMEQLRKDNIRPVELFLCRITETNPSCRFIFLSSQSAKENTSSIYGRLKWECEEIIRKETTVQSTIIVPGLVIGKGPLGLFSRLSSAALRLPVFPLVGYGDQLVQPIFVSDLVSCIVTALTVNPPILLPRYPLCLPPVKFKELIGSIAKSSSQRVIFLPLPKWFVGLALSAIERFFKNPPFTNTSLQGLLENELMDPAQGASIFAINLTPLDVALQLIFQQGDLSPLEKECDSIYQQLFRSSAPRTVLTQYEALHQHYFRTSNATLAGLFDVIVAKQLDWEAIEFALRRKVPALSGKLAAVSYLAEIRADRYHDFINTSSSRAFAWIGITLALLRTPIKYIKGRFLVWRYSLV